jgi:hypothetical protein
VEIDSIKEGKKTTRREGGRAAEMQSILPTKGEESDLSKEVANHAPKVKEETGDADQPEREEFIKKGGRLVGSTSRQAVGRNKLSSGRLAIRPIEP